MSAAAGQSWEANFVRNLERLRKAGDLTQTELARRLRDTYELPFHQQTIDRIESGKRPVRLDEAHQIADFFRTSVEEMTRRPGDAQLLDLRQEVGRAFTGFFGAVKDFLRAQDALRAAYQETEAQDPDLDRDVRVALSWTIDRLAQAAQESHEDLKEIRSARRQNPSESAVEGEVRRAVAEGLASGRIEVLDDRTSPQEESRADRLKKSIARRKAATTKPSTARVRVQTEKDRAEKE